MMDNITLAQKCGADIITVDIDVYNMFKGDIVFTTDQLNDFCTKVIDNYFKEIKEICTEIQNENRD